MIFVALEEFTHVGFVTPDLMVLDDFDDVEDLHADREVHPQFDLVPLFHF